MDLDLRIPVGLLFVILGLIMGIFGLTSDPAIYAKSLGINVNLYWGIVELIFGSLMIAFGRSQREVAGKAAGAAGASARPAGEKAVTARHDLPPPPVVGVKPPVRHG